MSTADPVWNHGGQRRAVDSGIMPIAVRPTLPWPRWPALTSVGLARRDEFAATRIAARGGRPGRLVVRHRLFGVHDPSAPV
jgi:hypothetical protein